MSLSTEPFAVLSNASHSNAALVNRYRQRDESAFTEIFERHRHLVYRVCLRYVGHHHDAEDITQETFRRAALAMPGVDSQRPIEPWLVTIAANRCRSFLSGAQRDRRVNSLDETNSPCGADHDGASRLALSEQIDLALDRLPADQRRAFELVHQKELSYPEAARVMGRPLGTVKTWVRRAKRDMQDTLRAADSLDTPATGLASTTEAETSTITASKRRTIARRSTVAIVASVVALGSLGVARRIVPSVAPHAAQSAIASTDASPHLAGRLPASGARGSGARGQVTEVANMDWQWVSLDAFIRTGIRIDVHALPLGQWIEQTSPALDHLRSGVGPLGSTLHRVAELFHCEIAQAGSLSAPGLGHSQPPSLGDVPSINDAAGFDEFGSTNVPLGSPRSSIS